jgi:hypothetical protein
MNTESMLKPMLEPLQPPAGGLQGLHRRLAARRRRRGLATTAAVGLLALVWFRIDDDHRPTDFPGNHPIQRLARGAPAEVRVVDGVVHPLASSQRSTRIYLVDSG